MDAPGGNSVRLAELVAMLSLGTDLGFGRPMDHVLRQSALALRMAELLELEESERAVLYFSSLLAWVGCHVDAFEQAKWFGDDIALKHDQLEIDNPGPRYALSRVGAGEPSLRRLRTGIEFVVGARSVAEDMLVNHANATKSLAESLGLGPAVEATVEQTFERWDGKGAPKGRRGDEILLTARLINLADVAEVYNAEGGLSAAVEVAQRRRGTQFDPALVDLFRYNADALFDGLDGIAGWRAVIAEEPELDRTLGERELDEALHAIAGFADLKTPWVLGHANRVAELAATAATEFGLDAMATATLRRAALLQDVGRLGVSNAIWDKPGALSDSERERMRMHVYYGERMTAFAAGLVGAAKLAAEHHERLDGSGYPRGLTAGELSPSARLLACTDVYCALTENRPHRAALDAGAAAGELRAEAGAGRLDGAAAEAVLRAAGHRPRGRIERPAGLTAREVEVLSLLARGLSSKEIAADLVISPKTARNHIERIYSKTGAKNRAMASLFAVRHGLASPELADSLDD